MKSLNKADEQAPERTVCPPCAKVEKSTRFCTTKLMPGGNSDVVPPESIPNSEVKHVSVDGSVGSPHVRVEHRQAPILRKRAIRKGSPFLHPGLLKPDKRKNRHPGKHGVVVRDPHRATVELKRAPSKFR